MKKPLIYIAILVTTLIFVYNKHLKDPWAVARLIKNGERAFEEENLKEGFRYISLDYNDDWGNDYKGLYKRASQFFDEFDNVEIVILKKKREFYKIEEHNSGKRKACLARFWILIDADFPHIGPARGQEYVKMEFKKENDRKWRVTSIALGE